MIRSFGNKLTEDVFLGRRTKRVLKLDAGLLRTTERKLDMIEAAARLDDLRVPPGNRLEAPRGDLGGLHSVRVNDQWRIVFRWSEGGADEVRLVDYH
jgi:proteic killer suppression protein